MPPKKAAKKRTNKRKSRTEDVSSASSSDSESATSEPAQSAKAVKKVEQEPKETALKADDDDDDDDDDEVPVFAAQKKSKQDADKVFEEFYLRQATREFANDLDKLRSAGDFTAKSVPLLVAALKQGTGCFSAEERRAVAEALDVESPV